MYNPRFDYEWEALVKKDKCPDCGKSAKGFIGGCVCKEESQSVIFVDIDSNIE